MIFVSCFLLDPCEAATRLPLDCASLLCVCSTFVVSWARSHLFHVFFVYEHCVWTYTYHPVRAPTYDHLRIVSCIFLSFGLL